MANEFWFLCDPVREDEAARLLSDIKGVTVDTSQQVWRVTNSGSIEQRRIEGTYRWWPFNRPLRRVVRTLSEAGIAGTGSDNKVYARVPRILLGIHKR